MYMQHKREVVAAIAITILIQFGSISGALAAPESSTLFKTKCGSCHTFGKGDRVGPDLKGVTERHSRAWLIPWIKSSETVIRRGDPVAAALFRKYRQQRMPEHDLSEAQINALLDYFEAGGPAAEEQQQMRLAAAATAQEIQHGRELFFGDARLTSGAVACVFCHKLSNQTLLGGTLAPDLSGAYPRYLDWALDQKLKRRCVKGTNESDSTRVAVGESLALRAFLRSVSADAGR
jgi:mono/diheme cytochrome c family protein